MRVSIVTVEPKSFRPPLTNDSFELVHVLKNQLEYGINEEIVSLKEGDTLTFDGKIPHSLRNKTSKETVLFKVYFMNSGEL